MSSIEISSPNQLKFVVTTFAAITSRSVMKFKEKIRKLCRVKYVILFSLILLNLWWGSNAVLRYWSQPLSTDISYKYGENEQGIQFPLITLCNFNLQNDDESSWNFLSALVSCMRRNKSDHMQNYHPENVVEMVQFWTGSKYVNFNGKVLTKVFHKKWGPCYTFDLSKVDKFKYVLIEAGTRTGIEFVIAENNPWKEAMLMLHTRSDLPDAYQLNGHTILPFSDEIKQVHNVEFRKKISKKESTRKAPCVNHEYSTCQSIEDNRLIFERFHCSVPILYSGPHLDELTPKEASNCNYDVTLEALDFISSKKSNCSTSQTCNNVRFTTKYKVQKTWLKNKNSVYVVLGNPEVEYHHSYISYNLESFVGEIGGILGITLGASALTLFESLFMRFSCY